MLLSIKQKYIRRPIYRNIINLCEVEEKNWSQFCRSKYLYNLTVKYSRGSIESEKLQESSIVVLKYPYLLLFLLVRVVFDYIHV